MGYQLLDPVHIQTLQLLPNRQPVETVASISIKYINTFIFMGREGPGGLACVQSHILTNIDNMAFDTGSIIHGNCKKIPTKKPVPISGS